MKALPRLSMSGLALGVLLLGARPAWAQPEEVYEPDPAMEPVEIHEVLPAGPSKLAHLRARVSPHGTWVHVSPHGEVWKPSVTVVGHGFRPYLTGGRWVSTEAGWSFESKWPWGDVVFHHGRWLRAADHGWVWVPGWRARRFKRIWRVRHARRRYVRRAYHPPRRHAPRRYVHRRHRYAPRRQIHHRRYAPRRQTPHRRYVPRRQIPHRRYAPRRQIHHRHAPRRQVRHRGGRRQRPVLVHNRRCRRNG